MAASVAFDALGGRAIVAVADDGRLAEAEAAARAEVAALDEACSRFRRDSELVALNAAAGGEVEVSELLFEAIAVALRGGELTGGMVDPTVGQALIALGYDRDFEKIKRVRRISLEPVPGWASVTLDPARRTVRLPAGVALDLGATAKALGADRAAARAWRAAGCGVLVGLSGDIAVAGPPPPGGWLVRVTDDHRAGTDAPGQWVTLRGGGLATSSTVTRRWRAGDATVHHLIDPRSGSSSTGPWRTVSVAAASCLEANIASTAALIAGLEALPWLRAHRLPSRLVSVGGASTHLAGWPAEGDELR